MRSITPFSILGCLVLATSGCVGDAPDSAPPTTGGKADDQTTSGACKASDGLGGTATPDQFPATAALFVPGQSDMKCAMTKIGDHEFLLAAHCFFLDGGQTGVDAQVLNRGTPIQILYGVYRPNQAVPPGVPASIFTSATIIDYRIHPSWTTGKPLSDFPTDGDAAILVVDADTPHIATAPIKTDPIDRCAPVVMQGYGCDSELKFRDARIDDSVGSMLHIGSGFTESFSAHMCPGDSGGALYSLASGTPSIVGINSRLLTPPDTFFTRLDDSGPLLMGQWVKMQLQELGIAPIGQLDVLGSVAQDEMKLYELPIPLGAGLPKLTISTTAADDVDLYLMMDADPTTENYTLRGYTDTGNETLDYDVPAAGTLHIGVYGYAPSDFRLTVVSRP